jgi:hypothetical protein
MNVEVGKVYTFKLSSGEEMVAKVHSECVGTFVNLEDPVSIAPGPKGMGLVPSIFTADPSKSITLNTNSVTMYAETDESVRMKYIEATTGIQVPDKKIILG